METQKLTVLDFDGTCTDAEEEGEGFTAAVIATLMEITGRNEVEIGLRYKDARADVLERPLEHGWTIDGRVVAPGTVDPYLRSTPVSRIVLRECGLDPQAVDAAMQVVGSRFHAHYRKGGIALRADLGNTLWHMIMEVPNHTAVIITNSDTSAVLDKLTTIPRTGSRAHLATCTPVFGGAKKYVLGELDIVPEIMEMPGLARPVYLRRPYYYEQLNKARIAAGVEGWANVTVIGDIFELDLALPLALGCRVGLAINSHTPSHEVQYFMRNRAGGRMDVIASMQGARDFALAG